jgi:hypothetical protein
MESNFGALPKNIIAKVMLLCPTKSVIDFYSVNSTHLKLFDTQSGLWEVLTRRITKHENNNSSPTSDEETQKLAYNTPDWKKEFRVVSYFNSRIRSSQFITKILPQKLDPAPLKILTHNHFKLEQEKPQYGVYTCLQSDSMLYPLPLGNFTTAYFEVEVLRSSDPDTPFYIGAALKGYSGAVGHGRSSYGYASDGTIYLECEISPEDNPATAELEHYSAHYYEVDEGLNPIRTDRKIYDGDIVGFGINFAKESLFFTKNGKVVFEAAETFGGDPKGFIPEPLYNLKCLYATLSLVNNVEVRANMGSHPFKFDLLEYQQKKTRLPSWIQYRQPAEEILRPYSELIIDHLAAYPDEALQEFDFRYGFKTFVADNNPPEDPSLIHPALYTLTYGTIPESTHPVTIDQDVLATYNSMRKIVTAKNVPILPGKPTTDIRRIVEEMSNKFSLEFGFHASWKNKIEEVTKVANTKLGNAAFQIIKAFVPQIAETTFKGNHFVKKWGKKLLAIHEYFHVERPQSCQWVKKEAAAIISEGRSEWSSHNNPEYIFGASVGAVSECRVEFGMKASVLEQRKTMIELKEYEREDIKRVFCNDQELIGKYDQVLTKLKEEIAPTRHTGSFPLFRRQKEIEFVLNGRGGGFSRHFVVLYGIYGLKISPNEFSSPEEYIREVAVQNRKLLTDSMKKEYLEHLLLLTKNLLIDNEFSGKLEYKVNRPMNAVFKVEMTQAFYANKSNEEKKQATVQYIQQELDKFPPPSTEKV